MAGPFVPQPPPQSRIIDQLSLVTAVDPRFRDPTITYEMENGRKFKEYVPANVIQPPQTLYGSSDTTVLYQPNPSPSLQAGPIFYAPRIS